MAAAEPALIHIRLSHAEDAEALEHLTDHVYGVAPGDNPGECLRAAHFRRHAALFPEGQFAAVIEGAPEPIIGLTASMRIAFDPAHPFIEPWVTTISSGWLDRHTPDGPWMYGVESAVDAAYRGSGVGSHLMDARFAVAKALNLCGMVAGGTLMDYCQQPGISPEDYLRGVVDGRYFDGNVSKQIRKGFTPIALIPDYVDDPCSLGWGAVIVWHNPAYDPARPMLLSLPPDALPPLPAFPLRRRA